MRGGSCREIRSGEGRRKTLSQIPGSSLRWRAALGLQAGEGGLGLLYLLLEQSCFLPAIAGECDLLGCIPSPLCQGQPGRSLINRGLLAQPPLLPCPSQRPGRQDPWDTHLHTAGLAWPGGGGHRPPGLQAFHVTLGSAAPDRGTRGGGEAPQRRPIPLGARPD